MERRHDELLTTRLEDAMLNGCSHITWNELYHWYGMRKLAAGTYRDLKRRWRTSPVGAKQVSLEWLRGGAGYSFTMEANRNP